jgi:hypothetical protein
MPLQYFCAITQYRTEALVAEEALGRIAAGGKSHEAEREYLMTWLNSRVDELESLVAKQRTEIEALRLLWPKSSTPII